jgi:hypothetical protein
MVKNKAMNIFKQVEVAKLGRNTFNLSHDRKMTMDMGKLIPFLVVDTIPGDKFYLDSSQVVKFAPLVAPPMHMIDVYTHYFFVPNRILWDGWEDFITGGEDGLDTTVFPTLDLTTALDSPGSLADYMGLPTLDAGTIPVSALPFAAYQKIYNEYYRDQNLISDIGLNVTDGNQTSGQRTILTTMRKRAWQHDYFTSALPWTQRGAEATIPLGTSAPLEFFDPTPLSPLTRVYNDVNQNTPTAAEDIVHNSSGVVLNDASTDNLLFDVTQYTQADLSTATAASINDLRRAFKLQEWLEKNGRGGSRYIEQTFFRFGVKSSDSRFQRPEYLGGGISPVTFSEVLQTSETNDSVTPQGNMAGHGLSVGRSNKCSVYCEEHGYIIGIMSVMPKGSYQEGIPKHFMKTDKFDFYQPEFARIGEQPIYNYEIYGAEPNDDGWDDVFGYTPRYSEYKFIFSSVHGDFKTSLDFWHLGRQFGGFPALNQTFIECDPDTRIFAVEDGSDNKLYVHVYNQVKASRLMPIFGTPTF